jgi:hypothetical protein
LRTDAAASFEDPAPWRITRIRVEQFGERLGLIAEAFSFACGISVYVI